MLSMLINHFANGNKTHFANMLGLTPQAINAWMVRGTFNPELIYEKIPEVSPHWLLSGTGNMLDICDKSTKSNDLYKHTSTECEFVTDDVEELPVIPSNLVNEPKVDIFKYIIENETDRSPVVQQFPESAAYYRIKTRSMEPYICPGDMLALSPYPIGAEKIVPGDPYVVDTLTNGLVTRILYNHPDGYLARTYNNDRFTDFVINREDIIRIFRIVGLIRINVQ